MTTTVFITGATGFIGGRLAEVLCLEGKQKVRVQLRRAYAGALRLARFDMELATTSLTDAEAMTAATKGCDVIYHLAFGTGGTPAEQRHITVESTRALVEAAIANKVRRFVYVSTAAVYSSWPDGPMDETAERRPWGWVYADSKLEAENLVLNACAERGLNAVILQVAGVYGPWGATYTTAPLDQLKKGRVALVADGSGISNATYVDDVVQALLLAGSSNEHSGQFFLIKGPGTITRRTLYETYAKMLGFGSERLVGMTEREISRSRRMQSMDTLKGIPKIAFRALVDSAPLRSAVSSSPLAPWARKLKSAGLLKKPVLEVPSASADQVAPSPEAPLVLPDPFMLSQFAKRTEIRTGKAEKLLGYKPQIALNEGMRLTEAWARWARIIP
ncbi:MAG: NAD-dependent epimerase/dehydratase family protein [Terrimicrobiaceae bacterium]